MLGGLQEKTTNNLEGAFQLHLQASHLQASHSTSNIQHRDSSDRPIDLWLSAMGRGKMQRRKGKGKRKRGSLPGASVRGALIAKGFSAAAVS